MGKVVTGRVKVNGFNPDELKQIINDFYGYNDVKLTVAEIDKGTVEVLDCLDFEISEPAKGYFRLITEIRNFLERLDRAIDTTEQKPATIGEMKYNANKNIGVNT